MAYFIAGLIGLFIGFIPWFIASRWIASSIVWAETRYPHLVGSKKLRAGEITACAVLVLACMALTIWIAGMLLR